MLEATKAELEACKEETKLAIERGSMRAVPAPDEETKVEALEGKLHAARRCIVLQTEMRNRAEKALKEGVHALTLVLCANPRSEPWLSKNPSSVKALIKKHDLSLT